VLRLGLLILLLFGGVACSAPPLSLYYPFLPQTSAADSPATLNQTSRQPDLLPEQQLVPWYVLRFQKTPATVSAFESLSAQNYNAAEALLTSALRQHFDARQIFNLAGVKLLRQEPVAARELLVALQPFPVALFSGIPACDLLNNLGVSHSQKGAYAQAATFYQQALQRCPDQASVLLNRGFDALLQRQPEAAQRDFARVSASPVARYGQALMRVLRQDHARAVTDLAAVLEQQPQAWQALLMRGNSRFALGQYLAATEDFTAVLKINPDYYPAYAQRAASHFRSEEFAESVADYTRYLEYTPGSADIFEFRARAWFRQGKYLRALVDFEKALERAPERQLLNFNLASAHASLRNYPEAIRFYQRYLAQAPTDAEAWYYLGNVQTYASLYPEAVASYTRSLTLEPGRQKALFNRATVYTQLKKYTEALADYDAFLQAFPEDGQTYFYKAIIYQYLGQCPRALELENRACQLGDAQACQKRVCSDSPDMPRPGSSPDVFSDQPSGGSQID
jgi:tetratricopeptide (TPR) repeat protein